MPKQIAVIPVGAARVSQIQLSHFWILSVPGHDSSA